MLFVTYAFLALACGALFVAVSPFWPDLGSPRRLPFWASTWCSDFCGAGGPLTAFGMRCSPPTTLSQGRPHTSWTISFPAAFLLIGGQPYGLQTFRPAA
jgi:hypothetical protein